MSLPTITGRPGSGQGHDRGPGRSRREVIILDFKPAESCLLRVKGFKEVIDGARRKGGKIRIVAELPGDGQKDQGYKAATDALRGSSQPAGIFAINDPSALGAWAASKKPARRSRSRSSPSTASPKASGRSAKARFTPSRSSSRRIGQETVKSILGHFDGEELKKEILIPSTLYRKADAEKDPEAR